MADSNNPAGNDSSHVTWCCPHCHGSLKSDDKNLQCTSCARSYPIICGIPDLRVNTPAWVDLVLDRQNARALDGRIARSGLTEALQQVFQESRGLSKEKAEHRARQVLEGVSKFDKHINGWLSRATEEQPITEIGCGAGQFLVACVQRGIPVSGVDVSLEWLIFAKHWLQEIGAQPHLVAAMGEKLPLADSTQGAIVSFDVLEHVGDQRRFVHEVARVLRPAGQVAMVTPNRFSLAPEPHVGVWGVGYLPVSLQAKWVGFFSSHSYAFTRLLGTGETRRLFRGAFGVNPEIKFPPIPNQEMSTFGRRKARIARLYNKMTTNRTFRHLMPLFGAYYRILIQKP